MKFEASVVKDQQQEQQPQEAKGAQLSLPFVNDED
jgi:hypothetical protein